LKYSDCAVRIIPFAMVILTLLLSGCAPVAGWIAGGPCQLATDPLDARSKRLKSSLTYLSAAAQPAGAGRGLPASTAEHKPKR
jgi:hypothetical protein